MPRKVSGDLGISSRTLGTCAAVDHSTHGQGILGAVRPGIMFGLLVTWEIATSAQAIPANKLSPGRCRTLPFAPELRKVCLRDSSGVVSCCVVKVGTQGKAGRGLGRHELESMARDGGGEPSHSRTVLAAHGRGSVLPGFSSSLARGSKSESQRLVPSDEDESDHGQGETGRAAACSRSVAQEQREPLISLRLRRLHPLQRRRGSGSGVRSLQGRFHDDAGSSAAPVGPARSRPSCPAIA